MQLGWLWRMHDRVQQASWPLRRALLAQSRFVDGLAHGLVPRSRRTEATIEGYAGYGDPHGGELYDWERPWYAAQLPTPPARVLLGAAGAGREARALAALGHEVVAFEPCTQLRVLAESRRPERCLAILDGSYEGLASPTTASDRGFCERVSALGPYGAVVLGWGSLSHVLDEGDRERLFHRLRELCPEGPVLASFWSTVNARPSQGRPFRAGLVLGSWLGGRVRPEEPAPETVFSQGFFLRPFRVAELEALAAATGWRLAQAEVDGTYAHATFRPAKRA